MAGRVVYDASPRQTMDANPKIAEARTLLWSRMIVFTFSQNWKIKFNNIRKGG